MAAEEARSSMTMAGLRAKAKSLDASVGLLWRQLGQLLSVHIMALGCVLRVAPPSELECSYVWMAVALALLVSVPPSVSFTMLGLRLGQRYAELYEAKDQLAKLGRAAPSASGENLARRGGRRSCTAYAVLGGLFFLFFGVVATGVFWCLACL